MKAYSLRNTLLSLLLSSYNTNAADFDVCKKRAVFEKIVPLAFTEKSIFLRQSECNVVLPS